MSAADSCIEYRRRGYRIHAAEELDDTQLARIVSILQQPTVIPQSPLEGRAALSVIELFPQRLIALKAYRRGGLFGKVVRSNYLRWGRTRAETEFRMLQAARAAGARVPQPIAWITRGGVWYSGWLLLEFIEGARTMAQVSREHEELLSEVAGNVVEQIGKLIRGNIFHLDLHPGNVLIGKDGEVVLIDFDKARLFTGTPNALRDRYLTRWRRAVIKHQLPEALSECLCPGLRMNFAD